MSELYNSPHQFGPLIPAEGDLPSQLLQRAAELSRAANRLSGLAHSETRATVRELVRSMNSYYSNRIEGQATHPVEIERALRREFSAEPKRARLQRIAIAHIEAEKELEQLATLESPMSTSFLVSAHKALYNKLSAADRVTDEGITVTPGELRTRDVKVGEHLPPTAESVPRFLERMDEAYDQTMSWDRRLVAVACLHQRAAWVHPFVDGNGRAIRLQSHCSLWEISDGLWSPSRGLARARDNYYAKLHAADAPRHGALDGRGNLTTKGPIDWIDFFVSICEDQVEFMSGMLALDGMKRRIEALVAFRTTGGSGMRAEAALPLYHAFLAGPLERGEFMRMTGLGERTARALLAHLLSTGLLTSDSHRAPVRFALPLDSLQFLFPDLYPEAGTAPPAA
jgi:Fic family protein